MATKQEAKETIKEYYKQVIPFVVIGVFTGASILTFRFLRIFALLLIAPIAILIVMRYGEPYMDALLHFILRDEEGGSDD